MLEWIHLVPEREWSGVLFCKPLSGKLGGYDTEKPVFEAIELMPMNIDSAGATSFDWSTDEYLNKVMDPEFQKTNTMSFSVHSHHTMKAYFSGVDYNEMRSKAQHNPYLMLIVNNRHYTNWVAQVGWPVIVEEKVSVVERFKNLLKTGGKNRVNRFQNKTSWIEVQRQDLDIVVDTSQKYVDLRLDENPEFEFGEDPMNSRGNYLKNNVEYLEITEQNN